VYSWGKMALSYASCGPRAGLGGLEMPVNSPPVVVVRPPTAGPWYDRIIAEEVGRRWLPPTVSRTPILFVLDLNSVSPSSDVLEELLVRAGQEVRARGHGFAALAVSTANASLRRLIEALAAREGLPLYISASVEPNRVFEAEPAGDLTATERETLEAVVAMGGQASASDLARRLELNNTAAGNRLTNLVVKGYLKRQSRPGRDGDLFIDPRFLSSGQSVESVLAAAREALSPDDFARTERLLRQSLQRRSAESVDA
jgi:MarR family